MKNQLINSIVAFCILSSAFCIHSNAQVVYTDVNPDQSLNTSSTILLSTDTIDLNNDGIKDFVLKDKYRVFPHGSGYSRTASIIALNNNAVVLSTSPYASALMPGTDVNAGLSWSPDTLTLRIYNASHSIFNNYWTYSHSGEWGNRSDDQYAGIKLVTGTQTYYGYFRLYVSSTAGMTLRSYAYNNTGQSISAGINDPAAILTSLSGTKFCAGGVVSVTFNTNGSFNSGNIFKAQLSDSTGSFTSSVQIGTHNGIASGTISCNVPQSTVEKNLYRIRVVSTNPVVTGSNDPVTLTINSGPAPAIITSQGSPIICSSGGSVTLNAVTSYAATYQWKKDGISLGYSETDPVTYVGYNTYGNFTIDVTNGCGTVTSNVIYVAVKPFPNNSITPSGTSNICAGQTIALSATSSASYSYKWFKNDVKIQGQTNSTLSVSTAGGYKVKVTDTSNNCSAKSSKAQVNITCRESNLTFVESLEQLSVYPNPASNSVTIKFPSDESGEIQIVNLFGQIVYSEKINSEQTQINVSKFSAGMYVVRWSGGENNETKTFSIVK